MKKYYRFAGNVLAAVVLAAILYMFWWLGRCTYVWDWLPLVSRPTDRLVLYMCLLYAGHQTWKDPCF